MSGSMASAKWERTPVKTASSIRPETALSSGLRASAHGRRLSSAWETSGVVSWSA